MPIFTVVQKTDAIIAFAQIHPFMSTGFEACPVPARVAVSWSLYIAPLDFVCRLRCEHIHWEGNFEHGVTFIPIDRRVEIQTWTVMIERNSLRKFTVLNLALDFNCLAQFAVLNHL